MPPKRKPKKEVSDQSEDFEDDDAVDDESDFVNESEEEEKAAKKKKPKVEKPKATSTKTAVAKKSTSSSSSELPSLSLGGKNKISLSEFKGQLRVDIREFYTDKASGEERPGKKGISLSLDQYKALKNHMESIDAAIEARK